MYQIQTTKNRGETFQKIPISLKTQVITVCEPIKNTYKLLQEDIIDENNTIVEESPWRSNSIAAILKLDNMYGKEGAVDQCAL